MIWSADWPVCAGPGVGEGVDAGVGDTFTAAVAVGEEMFWVLPPQAERSNAVVNIATSNSLLKFFILFLSNLTENIWSDMPPFLLHLIVSIWGTAQAGKKTVNCHKAADNCFVEIEILLNPFFVPLPTKYPKYIDGYVIEDEGERFK